MKTDVEKLASVGETLFGSAWQADMAEALGVSDRAVRYWMTERYRISEDVWKDLAAVCRKRAKALDAMAAKLEK